MTKPKFQISNFKFQIKNGFTLIELLVVISILGVLAGLVISNVSGVRERARDAERKSDLNSIREALEMYKADTVPPNVGYCPTNLWSTLIFCLSPATGTKYMNSVPNDPISGKTYYYAINASDRLDYTLYACLENKSDADGIADTSGNCASVWKYEVKPP